jgi:D-alanyl-D-alanine carboxypeptidase
MTKVAAKALEDLYKAALKEKGYKIYGVSAYRSYDRQYEIYGTNLFKKGIAHTNLYSAMPGASEHQTGLAIDVSCASIDYALDNRFASTKEGKWLKDNGSPI